MCRKEGNMSDIEGAIDQLVNAIHESDVYREYDELRDKVNQNPELKQQIDEFRHKNYELQNSDADFEKLEEFEKEYSQFREIPLVSDYLAAELAFCRMMQDINIKITDEIDFE
jgi:cell fate (sporulation/competence/biofilm development) regulator YlbF (YheA/YmcA/DUF963 family)